MGDTESLALIAIVNDQAAMLNWRTESAKHFGQEPSLGDYHQPYVDQLKKELKQRSVLR